MGLGSHSWFNNLRSSDGIKFGVSCWNLDPVDPEFKSFKLLVAAGPTPSAVTRRLDPEAGRPRLAGDLERRVLLTFE